MDNQDFKSIINRISIPEIRTKMIAPGDAGYDQARTPFYGGFDRRPAVIIRAADHDDVARVIELAHETGLALAVCSGGHSLAAYSVVDGGIVLDLSAMRALEIDAPRRAGRSHRIRAPKRADHGKRRCLLQRSRGPGHA